MWVNGDYDVLRLLPLKTGSSIGTAEMSHSWVQCVNEMSGTEEKSWFVTQSNLHEMRISTRPTGDNPHPTSWTWCGSHHSIWFCSSWSQIQDQGHECRKGKPSKLEMSLKNQPRENHQSKQHSCQQSHHTWEQQVHWHWQWKSLKVYQCLSELVVEVVEPWEVKQRWLKCCDVLCRLPQRTG